jgi:diamine N-acetyltransferase
VGRGDAVIAIRTAQAEDHDALAVLWREMDDLHASVQPAYFRRPAPTPRTRTQLERIMRGADQSLRVAGVDGEIVGVCHVELFDTPPLPWAMPARRAHVDSLIVAPGHRRQGIGRLLIEDAAGWARGRGAAELVLTVWAGNDDAARFYAALGFATVNTVLGRPL